MFTDPGEKPAFEKHNPSPETLARLEDGRLAFATAALTLLVLAFWIPRYPWNWTQLDQVADLALFALYSFALVDSAPRDIRALLGCNNAVPNQSS